MHGKNPPAWTTGKTAALAAAAAAAKEEQETAQAEAGKAANKVSLLEEGAHAHAHAHAQVEAAATARLGACMSAFAELQLHRTLHRAPDGAEDAGAVQTVKDMEDKLASTRSDAADAFTRCKDRADGVFNKRKGAFEREFRQREVAASGDAEAATDKAQLRLDKALKALAGQEEAGMKLMGDAEAGMEAARVVHSGAQGKKEAHDEAFVAGMESANELAGEARSMAETRTKRGLATKAGEAQEKGKTGAQTVLDEAEVALDARCGTMEKELTGLNPDERRAVALVHVHVSKLTIVGDDPTLLPNQDVPVAPAAGVTTTLDDKGEKSWRRRGAAARCARAARRAATRAFRRTRRAPRRRRGTGARATRRGRQFRGAREGREQGEIKANVCVFTTVCHGRGVERSTLPCSVVCLRNPSTPVNAWSRVKARTSESESEIWVRWRPKSPTQNGVRRVGDPSQA